MSEGFNKDFPSPDEYEDFAKEIKTQMEQAEAMGLKDFSKLTVLNKLTTQGVAMYYPAVEDEETGDIVPNHMNGKYHIASMDTIDTITWIEKAIWQERIKDFTVGTVMFIMKELREANKKIIEGNRSEMIDMAIASIKEANKTDDEPTMLEVAEWVCGNVLNFILEDKSAFTRLYKQVLIHTEPSLIAVGDIRGIASIIEGGYTNGVTKEEAVDMMNNSKLNDKDIENFFKEVLSKKEEEE